MGAGLESMSFWDIFFIFLPWGIHAHFFSDKNYYQYPSKSDALKYMHFLLNIYLLETRSNLQSCSAQTEAVSKGH